MTKQEPKKAAKKIVASPIRQSPAPKKTGASKSPVLLSDIRALIESSRERVAVGVNAELSFLYWSVGKRLGARARKTKELGRK